MSELRFLGIGSAFNTSLGNTSAFIKKEDSMVLIDCGGTVFHRLQQLNLLDNINNIYIIITHTHPDHVGSLGEVIFYTYYILKSKAQIIFRDKKLIKDYLNNIGVKSEMYTLHNKENVIINDIKLGEINIEFKKVSHVETLPSYGFYMQFENQLIYYSGDSNEISSELVTKIKECKIGRVYQDVCGLDYEGNNHLYIGELCNLIPYEYRHKIYCMHLDQHLKPKQIKEEGFNVVEKLI